MESLALFVGILLLVLILSGPLAIGLTFVKTTKQSSKILLRVLICLFSAIGIGLGVMLLLQGIAIGAKLMAIFAIAASAFALKREFKSK
ncbi:MAG: hypothetical protein F2918_02015 [Actinobacteria bacterium]|uniref:Unannotated protein n=1 Tax=freshwater metagenome TaxID=449393 RepID=A0A6J6AM71_9ZZZZ|nr:hypothetical protein [Actinomycetota bacterium]